MKILKKQISTIFSTKKVLHFTNDMREDKFQYAFTMIGSCIPSLADFIGQIKHHLQILGAILRKFRNYNIDHIFEYLS